ncbi:hypothetical protein INP83_15585 [Mucilaginibacter sp. 21P]|uniref:hypothetical protein n=1 Tax=Mucilaginibacter sp. 21P TaxID=2778902 RepID=UPI001C5595F1|nr:hypothetical protein [Mucilaginibacter sp. 21P]QXV64504.1 hypothetical protein INP83_15585 [Mucilaginibacter sp. 21P]
MLLKRSLIFRSLGLLLVIVFLAKSCDLFIEQCVAHHSAFASEKSMDGDNRLNNDSKSSAEDGFEKGSKKSYSYFNYQITFSSLSRIITSSIPWEPYSFGIFTEPLKVVLTPPPNVC